MQGQEKEIVLFVGTEDAAAKQVVVRSAGLAYLFRVDAAFLQDWPKEAKDWKVAPPAPAEGGSDKK